MVHNIIRCVPQREQRRTWVHLARYTSSEVIILADRFDFRGIREVPRANCLSNNIEVDARRYDFEVELFHDIEKLGADFADSS